MGRIWCLLLRADVSLKSDLEYTGFSDSVWGMVPTGKASAFPDSMSSLVEDRMAHKMPPLSVHRDVSVTLQTKPASKSRGKKLREGLKQIDGGAGEFAEKPG